jgi:hypothetical protein
MGLYDQKPCNCGSGKCRYELRDAAGIFCAYVCEDCEEKKKASYNPRIFHDWYDADQPEIYYADDY